MSNNDIEVDFAVIVQATSLWDSNGRLGRITVRGDTFTEPSTGCGEPCTPSYYLPERELTLEPSSVSWRQLPGSDLREDTRQSIYDHISREILTRATQSVLRYARPAGEQPGCCRQKGEKHKVLLGRFEGPSSLNTTGEQFWGSRLRTNDAERMSITPLNMRAIKTSQMQPIPGTDPTWAAEKLTHNWEGKLKQAITEDTLGAYAPGVYCP